METNRITVGALERILGKEFKVLDHGFVRLVDYMGGDESIVQAARVSYGKGTKRVSEDTALIRYLMRHRHTTPFEMCEVKFHVKLPIFVARQWIRHRTANVNEYSARYSVLDKQFFLPDIVSEQSNRNNQGRGDALSDDEAAEDRNLIEAFSNDAYSNYLFLLNQDESGEKASAGRTGMARELARMVLPTNYYTQWYWKIDLHNLFHFLSLRADKHAQQEIREYAEVVAEIVRTWVPISFKAFEDYSLNGTHLSSQERKLVQLLLAGEEVTKDNSGLNSREWAEFCEKFPESRL